VATPVSRHVQIIVTMANRLTTPAARMTSSLISMVRAARAAQLIFQGFSAIGGYFVQINKEMEDMKLAFASVFHAKGLVGTFAEGMEQSVQFVSELRKEAALLPGSFAEYAQVAGRSFNAVADGGFATAAGMADFISKFTAIGLMMKVPARAVGNSLQLIMKGAQTRITPMWQRLNGYMDVSLAQWKAMTAPERVERLNAVFDKFKDSLDAASNTWEAIQGTFSTHMQDIARATSAPYFEALKGVLKDLNTYLAANQAGVVRLLQTVIKLTAAVGVLKLVSMGVGRFAGTSLTGLLTRPRSLSITNPFAAGTMPGFKQVPVWSPLSLRLAQSQGLWKRTSAHKGWGEDAGFYFKQRVMGQKSRVVQPYFLKAVQNPLSGVQRMQKGLAVLENVLFAFTKFAGIAVVLWGLAGALIAFSKNTNGIRDILFKTIDGIAWHLQPAVAMFGQIAGMLNPEGDIGYFFATLLTKVVENMLDTVRMIAAFYGSIASMFALLTAGSWKARNDILANVLGVADKSGPIRAQTFTDFMDLGPTGMMASFYAHHLQQLTDDENARAGMDGKLGNLKVPNARNGPPVYDFRGSKFTITQQFAEGFDPDRIAVAFADDLSALADRRLQSAFAPVGAI